MKNWEVTGAQIAAAIIDSIPLTPTTVASVKPGMISVRGAAAHVIGVAAAVQLDTQTIEEASAQAVAWILGGGPKECPFSQFIEKFESEWRRFADAKPGRTYQIAAHAYLPGCNVYFTEAHQFTLSSNTVMMTGKDGRPNKLHLNFLASEVVPEVVSNNGEPLTHRHRLEAIIEGTCRLMGTVVPAHQIDPERLSSEIHASLGRGHGGDLVNYRFVPFGWASRSAARTVWATGREIDHLAPETIMGVQWAAIEATIQDLNQASKVVEHISEPLQSLIAASGLPVTLTITGDISVNVIFDGYGENLMHERRTLVYGVETKDLPSVEKKLAAILARQAHLHRCAGQKLLPNSQANVDLSRWRIEAPLLKQLLAAGIDLSTFLPYVIAMRTKRPSANSPQVANYYKVRDIEFNADAGLLRGRFQLSAGLSWAAGTLTIRGRHFPDTLVTGMKGMRLGDVIVHPLLPQDAVIKSTNIHPIKGGATYTMVVASDVPVSAALNPSDVKAAA